MAEKLTFEQVKKSMAELRRDVWRWRKEWPKSETITALKRDFDATYGVATMTADASGDFWGGIERKRAKLMTVYGELLGWHEGLWQEVVKLRNGVMKEATEIIAQVDVLQERVADVSNGDGEPNLATEINAEAAEVTEPKKATEIKEAKQPKPKGGHRAGSGRKSIGVRRACSLVLPAEAWTEIDGLIAAEVVGSLGEYVRWLYDNRPAHGPGQQDDAGD